MSMKATYNSIGSVHRNYTSETIARARRNNYKLRGKYGFLADMRLKVTQKFRAFRNHWIRENFPNGYNPKPSWKHHRRIAREFFGEYRRIEVSHYGKPYILNICRPYCVIVCAVTNDVVGVMPLSSNKVLISRSCLR